MKLVKVMVKHAQNRLESAVCEAELETQPEFVNPAQLVSIRPVDPDPEFDPKTGKPRKASCMFSIGTPYDKYLVPDMTAEELAKHLGHSLVETWNE